MRSVKDFSDADITTMYRQEYAQALTALGRFNLAIFGKTGTGKSTLVNAIFGQDVAATGTGRPVTTGLDYYIHPNGLLGIYDSRGFETGEAGDRILKALEDIVSAGRGTLGTDPRRVVHGPMERPALRGAPGGIRAQAARLGVASAVRADPGTVQRAGADPRGGA